MVDKPRETESFTKPMGKPGDERNFSKKGKMTRDEPYMSNPGGAGKYNSVGKSAKATPSKGDERVRGKEDSSKFSRSEPFSMADGKGQYRQVGDKAKATPSDGSERKDSSIKRKSPFRNA